MCLYSYSISKNCIFFLFKQKTAYEMRISDWSSDVCSSDLLLLVEIGLVRLAEDVRDVDRRPVERQDLHALLIAVLDARRSLGKYLALCVAHVERVALHEPFEIRARVVGVGKDMRRLARLDLREERSEEHTSELQSLMRISYAVF